MPILESRLGVVDGRPIPPSKRGSAYGSLTQPSWPALGASIGKANPLFSPIYCAVTVKVDEYWTPALVLVGVWMRK